MDRAERAVLLDKLKLAGLKKAVDANRPKARLEVGVRHLLIACLLAKAQAFN